MTIDTSREAVEQINEELSWDNSFGAIELINALLAERDAALAEVARLSHAHAAERKLADDLAKALDYATGGIACGASDALAAHAARRKE